MNSIDLLRARIHAVVPRPKSLRSNSLSSEARAWELEIPGMPEESLDYSRLSFAAESLEGIYYLPAILESCASRRKGFVQLLSTALVFLAGQHEHAPLGTYSLLLRTLEGIFASWTSTFARKEGALQYWDYGGPRLVLSPVVDSGERDSFLTDVCRRELSYRGAWFSELIFWVWSGDDMPERAAHLVDYLYKASTSVWLIREECYREPAVIRLLIDADFCRWRWLNCRDYFRSVVGDEYADEVQRVLVDDRPLWMFRAGRLKIRDSAPRGDDRFYVQDSTEDQMVSPMSQSEGGSAYLEAIRRRDKSYDRLRTLISNASQILYLMKDRESQGLRAFGVSAKNATPPEFPQGPALFDVGNWPSGDELKQAYEALNAGNEAVFAAWDLLSDAERTDLPQPNILRPTHRQREG